MTDVQAIVQARRLAAEIRSLRFLDALDGEYPAAPFTPADPRNPRFRLLRALPGMGARPRGDRLAQIWLRDHRRCILFHALMRSSAWANEVAVSLSVAELARLSGLSAQSVLLALRDARAAGDFTSLRAEEDRRLLLLEPAAALGALADARRRAYVGVACALTGRRDPTPGLSAAGEQAWRRLYAELCVNKIGGSAHRDRRLAVARRALLLWDLVAEGPQRRRHFVPAQQERSGASRQTVLNHLAWLRAQGWLEPGDPLRPTRLARERFGAMLGVFEACAHRVLDLLELLAARPDAAACLLLPPDDTASPRSWLRCRFTHCALPAPRAPSGRSPPFAQCQRQWCPFVLRERTALAARDPREADID